MNPDISFAQNTSLAQLTAELTAVSDDLPGNQELLRSVLAGCGDCIKILDLDGRLQFMSEGGKRVMEVDDFSVLKGCPWPEFWHGEGNATGHRRSRVGQTRENGALRRRRQHRQGHP